VVCGYEKMSLTSVDKFFSALVEHQPHMWLWRHECASKHQRKGRANIGSTKVERGKPRFGL
jgi:hypothetical protein